MNKNKNHLPLFGVGPLYVILISLIEIFALILHIFGYLDAFNIIQYKIFFNILGIIIITEGVSLLLLATVFLRIDEKIKQGILVTNGIFKYVRNPIYSAYLFTYSGLLILFKNWILLLLPIIFWLFLTILMKKTEEKWLEAKFGKEYLDYCSRTNRCIPFFLRNIK